MQTVKSQMRQLIMSHLISIYDVCPLFSKYRLEAIKRNLHNKEPEASVASEGFLSEKISLFSL